MLTGFARNQTGHPCDRVPALWPLGFLEMLDWKEENALCNSESMLLVINDFFFLIKSYTNWKVKSQK